MSGLLKVSTTKTILLGPFIDSTDGIATKEGLSIATADVRLSKNGGSFAAKNDTTATTHAENGYYSVSLNTTDTGTLGLLKVVSKMAGALLVEDFFLVVPANIYDALVSGSDNLQVHTNEITNGLIVAATFASNALDAVWSTSARTLTAATNITSTGSAVQLHSDNKVLLGGTTHTSAVIPTVTTLTNAVTVSDKTGFALSAAGVAGIWDALLTSISTAGSIGRLIEDNLNATVSSRSSHSATDVWAAAARTLTAATNITSTGSAVQLHSDNKVLLAGTTHTSAVIPTVSTLSGSVTVSDKTGFALSTAGIAAVWDALLTGITTAGSIGKLVKDYLDAAITSRSSHTAADTWSVGARTLTAATNITSTGSAVQLHSDNKVLLGGTTHTSAVIPTVSTLTNAVTVSDKTGFALSTAGIAGIWDALLTGITTAGSIGKLVKDYLDAAITSRSSHAAADIWSVATRTLSAATNLTSNGAAITLHTDNRVLIAGTTHNNAVIPTVSAVTGAVGSVTAAVTLTSAYDAAKTAAQVGSAMTLAGNALSAAALATDAVTEIVGALLGATVPAAYGAGTLGYIIGTNLDAAIGDLVIPDTTAIRAQVDAGIEYYRLNELIVDALGSAPDASSLFGELTEDDAGVRRFTANALEMGPTGEGSSPATIAAEVWNSVLASYQVAGSMGEAMANAGASGSDPWTTSLPGSYTGTQAGKLLNDVLSRANALPLASAIRTEMETATGKLDLAYVAVTSGALSTNVGAIKAVTDTLPAEFLEAADIPTVAQIRAEMDASSTRLSSIDGMTVNIEETLLAGGHVYTQLADIKAKTQLVPASPAAVGDIPSAATIATQVLSSAVPAAYGAGTLGYIIGTNLDAAVSSIESGGGGIDYTETLGLIKAKTDTIPAGIATSAELLTAAQVDTLLLNYRLNQLMSSNAGTPVAGSFFGHILELASGVYRFKATALATAPAPDITLDTDFIAEAVLDRPLAAHTQTGTVGKKLFDQTNLTQAQVSTAVWTVLPANYGLVPNSYGWMLDARVSGMLANEAGTGSVEFVYTVTNNLTSQPVPDVIVTVTDDIDGQVVIARARTNDDGEATFNLNPGTYYLWRSKAGWNFTNPDTEEIV